MHPDNPNVDLRAEAAVLGAILLDNTTLRRLELSPHDFYRESHRHIYLSMVELEGDGSPIDAVTLCGHLKEAGRYKAAGGAAYIVSLVNETPAAVNIDYYAERVAKVAKKRLAESEARRVIDATKEFVEALRAAHHEEEVQKLVDHWETSFLASANAAVAPFRKDLFRHRGHQWLGEALRELDELYLRAAEQDVASTITTTFDALDDLIEYPGDNLIVIGARPGTGKSAFAVTSMDRYSQRGEVPYMFILEDSTKTTLYRLFSQKSKLPLRRVRHLWERRANHPDAAADFDILNEHRWAMPTHQKMGFDDTPHLSIEAIRMRAKNIVRQGATQLWIDHALRVRRPRDIRETRNQISHIINEAASLAQELNVPVFLLTQIVRMEKNRRPTMDDLKETGTFEESARAIVLLYRQEYSAQEKGKKVDYPHPIELIVPKANHDAVGTAYAMFEPEHTLLREPTTAELEIIELSRKSGRLFKEEMDMACGTRSYGTWR